MRVFPIAESEEAFRFMAQSKHIGKIVVMHGGTAGPEKLKKIRGEATYLITGGLGGLGLAVAERMVRRGARHLVFAGGSAPSTEATVTIEQLRSAGAQIVVSRTDISRKDEVAKLLAEIDSGLPPLRGVIHSAGVLHDGVLTGLK